LCPFLIPNSWGTHHQLCQKSLPKRIPKTTHLKSHCSLLSKSMMYLYLFQNNDISHNTSKNLGILICWQFQRKATKEKSTTQLLQVKGMHANPNVTFVQWSNEHILIEVIYGVRVC
jgi:hypothetical protein